LKNVEKYKTLVINEKMIHVQVRNDDEEMQFDRE
jgi:hypothetical protein